MANIYGVPTAKFKPFTFEEMLKPALMATEAHNQLEENYSNLAVITANLEDKLKNNPKDAELRKTYEQYRDALNNASEELYSKGLSSQSRRVFSQLKTDYASKIDPINKAYAKYQAQQDIINKLAITNPEIIVTGASDAISDYMGEKNPELASVNLDKLMNQAMTGAKADAIRTRRVSKWTPTAGGKFLERAEEMGLTNAEFEAAIANIERYNKDKSVKLSENAQSILNLINDVSGNSNYGLLKGVDQQRAYEAILTGIRLGYAYDKKIQTQSNPGYAYAKAKAEQEAKLKEQMEKLRKELLAGRNVGSNLFITADTAKQNMYAFFNTDGSLKKEYEKYFDSKGNLKSEEEIQKLTKDIALSNNHWENLGDPLSTNPSLTRRTDRNYHELKEAMTSLGLKEGQLNLNNINLMLNSNVNNTNPDGKSVADGISRMRGTIRLTGETDRNHAQILIEEGLKSGENLKEVIGLNADGTYKTQSSKYDKLLTDDKLNVTQFEVDYRTGDIIFKVKTKKDGIKEFILPAASHYKAQNYNDLINYAANINLINKEDLTSAIDPNVEAPDIFKTYGDLKQYYINNMDDILLELLNKHGTLNVNK